MDLYSAAAASSAAAHGDPYSAAAAAAASAAVDPWQNYMNSYNNMYSHAHRLNPQYSSFLLQSSAAAVRQAGRKDNWAAASAAAASAGAASHSAAAALEGYGSGHSHYSAAMTGKEPLATISHPD